MVRWRFGDDDSDVNYDDIRTGWYLPTTTYRCYLLRGMCACVVCSSCDIGDIGAAGRYLCFSFHRILHGGVRVLLHVHRDVLLCLPTYTVI